MKNKNIKSKRKKHSIYMSAWYKKNKEKWNIYRKKHQKEMKEWFLEYKKNLKCIKCGFDKHPALDFHHIDKNSKDRGIAKMLESNMSKKSIIMEIEKCIVLCSNCHRILHYEERNALSITIVSSDPL